MSALTDLIEANITMAWNAIQTDDDWAFLRTVIFDPSGIAPFAQAMGWETLEEAAAAVAVLNALAPEPEPAELEIGFTLDDIDKVISSYALPLAILEGANATIGAPVEIHIATGWRNWTGDSWYHAPTMEQALELLAHSPTDEMVWVNERNDCGDFARAELGWLSSEGFGNVSIGTVSFRAFGGGQELGTHDCNVLIDNTGTAWFVEPQNNHVYPFTDAAWIYPTATDLIITGFFI